MNEAMNKVLQRAESWVGKYFKEGESAQCANFVRNIFAEAGVPVGTAAHPSDASLLPGEPQGPSYANSFAGAEIGEKITSLSGLQPGDIVMFKNTYGNFPAGVITHVGIVADKDCFIHRPTFDRPVQRASLRSWQSLFAEGRRPAYGAGFKSVNLQYYQSRGLTENSLHGAEKLKIFTSADGKLSVFVNDAAVKNLQVAFIQYMTAADSYLIGRWPDKLLILDPRQQSFDSSLLAVKGSVPQLSVKGRRLSDVNLINCTLIY